MQKSLMFQDGTRVTVEVRQAAGDEQLFDFIARVAPQVPPAEYSLMPIDNDRGYGVKLEDPDFKARIALFVTGQDYLNEIVIVTFMLQLWGFQDITYLQHQHHRDRPPIPQAGAREFHEQVERSREINRLPDWLQPIVQFWRRLTL